MDTILYLRPLTRNVFEDGGPFKAAWERCKFSQVGYWTPVNSKCEFSLRISCSISISDSFVVFVVSSDRSNKSFFFFESMTRMKSFVTVKQRPLYLLSCCSSIVKHFTGCGNGVWFVGRPRMDGKLWLLLFVLFQYCLGKWSLESLILASTSLAR